MAHRRNRGSGGDNVPNWGVHENKWAQGIMAAVGMGGGAWHMVVMSHPCHSGAGLRPRATGGAAAAVGGDSSQGKRRLREADGCEECRSKGALDWSQRGRPIGSEPWERG